MVIVKPTKSGKGITIIDDFGNVYVGSKTYLLALVSGRMKAPFMSVTRMPMPSSGDRFQPSNLLGPDNEHITPDDPRWTPPQCSHTADGAGKGNDGLSVKMREKRESVEAFKDKKVEW